MFRASKIALTAAFVAMAVALGYLLAALPNVELVTLTVFLGGAVAGPALGVAIGALTELLFSFLNPLGPVYPLVFAAQIVGMGVTGLVGGLVGARLAGWPAAGRGAALATLGLVLTLLFDVLTNAGLGVHLGPIRETVVGGLAFAVVHLVSNTLVFAALGTPGLAMLADLGRLEKAR